MSNRLISLILFFFTINIIFCQNSQDFHYDQESDLIRFNGNIYTKKIENNFRFLADSDITTVETNTNTTTESVSTTMKIIYTVIAVRKIFY